MAFNMKWHIKYHRNINHTKNNKHPHTGVHIHVATFLFLLPVPYITSNSKGFEINNMKGVYVHCVEGKYFNNNDTNCPMGPYMKILRSV